MLYYYVCRDYFEHQLFQRFQQYAQNSRIERLQGHENWCTSNIGPHRNKAMQLRNRAAQIKNRGKS